MKGKWAVTGAAGFVGQALCLFLERSGEEVQRVVRNKKNPNEKSVGEIGPDSDWISALTGCRGVIHLAARVHLMEDKAGDPMVEYRKVNTEGTLELAKQAAKLGVRRFVFVSSIKVNGESGYFSQVDRPAPTDPYSFSKFEAEEGLKTISQETGLEVVILRPPLVYGPGVGANFYRLLKAVDQRLPLPLGGIRNRRSLIFLGNLIDAIKTVMYAPQAAGKTYLVSDNEVVSTPDLIRFISQALGRKPSLIAIPSRFIKIVARLTKKDKEVERLLGNLEVDNSRIREELGWSPPHTLNQGIIETVQWYKSINSYDKARF